MAVAVVVVVPVVVPLVRVAPTPTAISSTSAASTAAAVGTGRPALELFVLLSDIAEKIFAELLGFLHHLGIGAPALGQSSQSGWTRSHLRNMQEHVLIALSARRGFHVARAATLDLHAAAGFLLDMLDISAAVSNNLRAEIEAWHRLQPDRNLFLGPFALFTVSRY